MHRALTPDQLEMPFNLEVVLATGRLASEALVDRHQFVAEREDLILLHIRELLRVTEGNKFAFAFANWRALCSLDGEVIAAQAEHFFFERENSLIWGVEFGIGWLGA